MKFNHVCMWRNVQNIVEVLRQSCVFLTDHLMFFLVETNGNNMSYWSANIIACICYVLLNTNVILRSFLFIAWIYLGYLGNMMWFHEECHLLLMLFNRCIIKPNSLVYLVLLSVQTNHHQKDTNFIYQICHTDAANNFFVRTSIPTPNCDTQTTQTLVYGSVVTGIIVLY